MKTVALYSPYIPKHSGGGERYLLSIAEAASSHYRTILLVPQLQIEEAKRALKTYAKAFGLDLSRVGVESTGIGMTRSPIQTWLETKQYDVLFAMTDGSIFPSASPHSYLIMQIPWTRRLGVLEQLKLQSWSKVLVYSSFVSSVLFNAWNISKLEVLSPYVDLDDFMPGKKEKLIITTGRFFAHTQSNSKRQDVLIDAFAQWIDRYHAKGWHFALLGNIDPNPDSFTYVEKLKEAARGYPISIHPNLSYAELRAFYARATYYWHATGYAVDEQKSPENTEHFGITTLEAMASGAIPLVIPKGGQPEIVGNGDLYWNTIPELVGRMQELCGMEKEKKNQLVEDVQARAAQYSKEIFKAKVLELI